MPSIYVSIISKIFITSYPVLYYNISMSKIIPPEQLPLTIKQKEFCNQYLIDLNATQAAIRAGYSQKTAAVIACQFLIKLNIQQHIAELQAIRSERTHITQDKVLREAARLLFTDTREIASWKNRRVILKDSSQLSDDVVACIESVSQDKNGLSIKCHSKTKALELVMRHLGLLNDKLNLGGQPGNPVSCQPIFNCVPESIPLVKDLLAGKKPDVANDKQPDESVPS
jgi:phage terminase small subunit